MNSKGITAIFLRIVFCLTAFHAFGSNYDSWTISAPVTYEGYYHVVQGTQAGHGHHVYYIDVPEGYVANVTIEHVSDTLTACQRGSTRVLVNGSSISPASTGGYTATLKHSSLGGYGRVEIYVDALWPYDWVVRYVYDWTYNIKVVYSKVAVTSFTVTFNGNGGTPATQARDVKVGYDIGTLPTATRAGYTFAGWWTQATGGTQASSSDIPLKNIAYYAHWIANTSSIIALTITGDDEVESEKSARYKCYGITSDGGQIEVVPTWSLTSSCATISSSGLLSASRIYGRQLVNIQAAYANGGKTHSATKSVLITPVKPICKINSNGVLTDVDMNGCSGITFDGSVKSIGDGVFWSCSNLTQSVSISYGITNIGVLAFASSAIPSAILAYSVERIGDYAFADCKGISNFNVEEGVKVIGEGILAYCSSLKTLTVSTNNSCFYSTNNLIVSVADNSILQYAVGRSGSCTVPSGVEKIGSAAFCGASKMTEIKLPSSIKEIGGDAFNNCSSISMLSLPQNLERIGDYAFAGCSGISEMRIPECVSYIGEGAFFGCTNLVRVYFEGHAPTNVVSAESLGLPKNCRLFVRKGSSGWDVDVPGNWNGLQIQYEEGKIIKPAAPDVCVSGSRLTWTPVREAKYYKVYRSTNPFAEPEECSQWLDAMSCNIAVPAAEGTVYFYFVKASIDGSETTASPFSKVGVTTSSSQYSSIQYSGHPSFAALDPFTEFHLYGCGAIEDRPFVNNLYVSAQKEDTITVSSQTGGIDVYVNSEKLDTELKTTYSSSVTFDRVTLRVVASLNGSSIPRSFSFYSDVYANPLSESSTFEEFKENRGYGWKARPHYFYQAGATNLSVDVSSQTVDCTNGVYAARVTATPNDVPWTAQSSVGWIVPYFDSHEGSATLAYVVSENTTSSTRTGIIMLTCGDCKKIVEVRQSEADRSDVARYKVTFGKNGGTGGDDYVTATYGKPMPTPRTAPTRPGLTFAGYWDTLAVDANGNPKGKQYYDGTMKSVRIWDKNGTATLWAKWTAKVTFGKNGGTGGDDYVTATYGKPMPTPRTAPKLSGWTFAGYWDTLAQDANGTPKGKQYYDANMKSVRSWDKTAASTLWAKWTNRVTLGKNGGTGGDSYVTCTKGQPMPKRTMPTKSGYVFDGYWNTTGAGGVKYYNADGTSAHAWDKSGSVTLWAKWVEPVACKVTLGKNGGSGGDNYVTATTGKPMPTPRTAPKRTGWTFEGYWDTLAQDANGNPLGKQYYDANMKSVRNWDKTTAATLWAKWTVRVKLGKNGGTGGDDEVVVTYNQPFPKKTMPKRTGYTFGGYFVSSSSKTGQCYNADGTGTSSMKWTTGGMPTVWALWTKTSSSLKLASPTPVVAQPPVTAAPEPIPAGLYSGMLADGSGMFYLTLDEPGLSRTAYLYIVSQDGIYEAECTAEESGGLLLLTTESGQVYAIDLDRGQKDKNTLLTAER